MTDFAGLLKALAASKVDFLIVGGAAATVHGSARLTQDLDVVYSRDAANLDRLASALAPLHPSLRGAPPGLPFRLDPPTLRAGLNFTLTTELGDLDLRGEIAGGGSFRDLRSDSIEVEIFGFRCLCLGLSKLIAVKRAAGRPKDLEVAAELEAIRDETKRV